MAHVSAVAGSEVDVERVVLGRALNQSSTVHPALFLAVHDVHERSVAQGGGADGRGACWYGGTMQGRVPALLALALPPLRLRRGKHWRAFMDAVALAHAKRLKT